MASTATTRMAAASISTNFSVAQFPRWADPAITELRQQLARAEATIAELRERLDDALAKLADAQAELAAAQDHAEAVSARAVAAVETEQGLRQADAERRARGRFRRILAAWRGE